MGKPRNRPARGTAFGILNPWGDVWTYETFSTEAEARQHIKNFWTGIKSSTVDVSRFSVVEVRVTVSVIKPKDPTPSPQAETSGEVG